jgi:hypothetical protein
MQSKEYVGFIDSDNYFPGAVNEYVKIFATGFAMSTTPYCNVRILWRSKPKVVDNKIRFPRWGRISQTSNKYLNALISYITGNDTDIIVTGNAGEHALSMSLAENLHYSSGYSVEPYEFINILEKYGGLLPTSSPSTSTTSTLRTSAKIATSREVPTASPIKPSTPSSSSTSTLKSSNSSSSSSIDSLSPSSKLPGVSLKSLVSLSSAAAALAATSAPSVTSVANNTLSTSPTESENKTSANDDETTSKPTDSEIMKKGVEIFQIESRDPHLHEEKGDEHLADMMEDSLLAINNSKICHTELTKELNNQLYTLQVKQSNNHNSDGTDSIVNSSSKVKHYYQSKKHKIMDPIKRIPILKFCNLLQENSKTLTKI